MRTSTDRNKSTGRVCRFLTTAPCLASNGEFHSATSAKGIARPGKVTQKGSLEAGCAEHPTKPIQKATLLSAIRRLSPPFIESKFQSKIGSAAVFCVDENSAIQALDRLDRCLPLSPGRAEKHGFENAVKLLANLSNAVFSDFNFGAFEK